MDRAEILTLIDAEIERLHQVKSILSNGIGKVSNSKTPKPALPKKRILSAKARKAIAEAQRKRWAKVHAAQKKSASAKA
jgi:hypothetical protein